MNLLFFVTIDENDSKVWELCWRIRLYWWLSYGNTEWLQYRWQRLLWATNRWKFDYKRVYLSKGLFWAHNESSRDIFLLHLFGPSRRAEDQNYSSLVPRHRPRSFRRLDFKLCINGFKSKKKLRTKYLLRYLPEKFNYRQLVIDRDIFYQKKSHTPRHTV